MKNRRQNFTRIHLNASGLERRRALDSGRMYALAHLKNEVICREEILGFAVMHIVRPSHGYHRE